MTLNDSPSPQSSQEHPVNVCKAALSLSRISSLSLQGLPAKSHSGSLLYTDICTVTMGVSVLAWRCFFWSMYSLKGLSAWEFPWTWSDYCENELTYSWKGNFSWRWLLSHQFLLKTKLNVHISADWNGFIVIFFRWWRYDRMVQFCRHAGFFFSECWCGTVQIRFNDCSPTVMFSKKYSFTRSLRLVLVLYSSFTYQ